MPLKCIAIDDEPLALELIKNYVGRIPELQLLHTFDDALSGAEFLKKGTVDLLFVDINMPDITGVELVRSLEQRPMVIFTTAYKNYAYEGFELEAMDYLLKPIDFNRFSKAVDKAIEYHKYKNAAPAEDNTESLYVYSEYTYKLAVFSSATVLFLYLKKSTAFSAAFEKRSKSIGFNK